MTKTKLTLTTSWNVITPLSSKLQTKLLARISFYQQFLKFLIISNINYISVFKIKTLVTCFKNLFSRPSTNRWQNFKSTTVSSTSAKTTSTFFSLQKLPSYTKLFLTYLEYAQTSFTFFYKPHFNYKLIFNISLYKTLVNLNLKKFMAKWSTTLLLFSNFAYFNIQTYSFGNKFLWKEILALNYKNTLTKVLFFKQINKRIFFKDLNWNEQFVTIFKRFKKEQVQNLIFWDLTNHRKNLIYFKKINFFIIGLVPLHQNPWDVHYAVPLFSSSLLIQYYFINFYIYIYTYTKNQYFNDLKKKWYLLYL